MHDSRIFNPYTNHECDNAQYYRQTDRQRVSCQSQIILHAAVVSAKNYVVETKAEKCSIVISQVVSRHNYCSRVTKLLIKGNMMLSLNN